MYLCMQLDGPNDNSPMEKSLILSVVNMYSYIAAK